MKPAVEQLAALLPPVWPSTDLKGVNPEDTHAQASLDLTLGRDPATTGSRPYVVSAGAPYKGSGNHEFSERCVESLRRNDPAPLLEGLRKQETYGHLCMANRDETLSPYVGFYGRDVCAGLLRFGESGEFGKAALRWLGHELWCSEECEYPLRSGDIYAPGTRWHPGQACPEFRRGRFAQVLRGESIDTSHRQMGHAKGSIMAGGMPVASNVWLALACREAGIFKEIEPIRPKLAWPLRVERSPDGILAYLERCKQSDPYTMLAVEMRRDWARPRLYPMVSGGVHTFEPQERRVA